MYNRKVKFFKFSKENIPAILPLPFVQNAPFFSSHSIAQRYRFKKNAALLDAGLRFF
jgi:hypothetical protein